MLFYILTALGGYLLGCSNMAFYLEKLMKNSVRGVGSGTLGASNAVILLVWKAGILVGAHDIGKALLAVYLTQWLLPDLSYAPAVAGVACVLGHIFPFYLKFKGGKGFASYVGMAFALNWKLALVIILLIFVVTVLTDYIVSATVMSAISFPLSMGIYTKSWILVLVLCIASGVMLWRHRENLIRIFIKGNEIGFRSAAKGEHRIKK